MKTLNKDSVMKTLDAIYDYSLDGLPTSKSVYELANDYISTNIPVETAVKRLIHNQVKKCGTSGFLTGLGGFLTLPITIPVNLTSVLYIQMRMVAAIAHINGFDLKSDQVKTFVYVCLTGKSMTDVLKNAGIQFGKKYSTNLVKKIPGAVLTKINQKLGFRFLTKFGSKGIINLGKGVPVIGGAIGGTFDILSTKIIAKNAVSLFIKAD